jgi:hypothetical protein
MRIDSNKFYSVRLEVDIFVMKSLRDEVTGRPVPHRAGARRDHQRLQPAARTAVFGTALDRPDPFTYTGTETMASQSTGNFNIMY